jgi:hypothetical protein
MRETGWMMIFLRMVKILDTVRIGGETWMDRARAAAQHCSGWKMEGGVKR